MTEKTRVFIQIHFSQGSIMVKDKTNIFISVGKEEYNSILESKSSTEKSSLLSATI